MTKLYIGSYPRQGGTVSEYTWAQIQREPMFFRAERGFAYKHGGPLTREFLDALTPEFDDCFIETRFHYLLKGWVPSLPGWHFDSVERKAGKHDFSLPFTAANHAMVLVGDPVCRTQFAVGGGDFEIPEDEPCFKVWDKEVNDRIARGDLQRISARMRRVYYFSDRVWHQAVPATGEGGRWFARATINAPASYQVQNAIVPQVQVYLPEGYDNWRY